MVNFWEDPNFASSLGPNGLLTPDQAAAPQDTTTPQAVKETPAAAPSMPAMWTDGGTALAIWEGMRSEVNDVPTDANVLLKGFNGLMDITGSAINRVGDALSYPSDRLEQLVGTAWLTLEYGNEIPSLADRWNLAQLSWEWTGFGKGALRDEGVRIAATGDTEALQKYIDENEGGVSQFLMSFVADPLNLFGIPGLGYAAKGAKALGLGKNAVTALELMNRGVRGDDLIQLGFKLPPGLREASTFLGEGMKKVGVGGSYLEEVQKRQWDLAFGIMERGEYGKYMKSRRLQSHSFLKNLYTRTPQSVANEVASNGMDELRFMLDSGAAHPEMQTYLAALTSGNLEAISKINPAYANDVRAREFFDAVAAEAQATGFDITKLKSFNTDPTDPVQVVNNILGKSYGAEKIITMKPEELRAAWEAQFFADMQGLVLPASQHWAGIGGDVIEQNGRLFFAPSLAAAEKAAGAQSLHKLQAGYKKWLSVFYLNRPGFVSLNVGNNTATGIFDGMGFARGIPEEELAAWGLSKAGLAQSAKDVGSLADVLGNAAGTKHKWFKTLTPWIQLASKHDQMARRWVEFKQYRRTMQGIWQFREDTREVWKGVLPQLPKNVVEALGEEGSDVLKSRILATRGDPKKIRALGEEWKKGTVIADAEYYLTRALTEDGFKGDNLVAAKDVISDGFQHRFDTLLADGVSPQDAAQILRGESLRYAIDYGDVPLDKLITDTTRGYNRQQSRILQMEKIRRERDALGTGITRYMTFNGHEPADLADMESLLVSSYKADEGEWTKLYDILDTPDVSKAARDKAWREWDKARSEGRAKLRKDGLEILSRHPGNSGAAGAWARVLETDAATHQQQAAKLRETLDAVDALPKQNKVMADEIRAAKGELTHMTNRLAKIRRGGYAEEAAQTALPQATEGGLTAADVLKRAAQRRGEQVAEGAAQAAPEARAIPTEAETEAAIDAARTKLNDLMERANANGELDYQKDQLWKSYFKSQDEAWQAATDAQLGHLGLDRSVIVRPRSVPEPGLPDTASGALRAFDARERILNRIANWNDLPAGAAVPQEAAASLRAYFRQAESYGNEARYVAMQSGRATADFVYHNYNNMYGFDEILKFIAPYEFWPTRSMYKWAQRTMRRPGGTAAFAKLIESQNGFDIPERLKGKFKIPIPFMPEWMGGGVYVDPIQVLFPYARDFAGNDLDNEDGPLWQRISDTMGRVGLSPSPFLTMPLAMTGDGERSQFINFQMNGLPWFIPGTNAQRAITALLMGAPDSEWKDTLQPEDIQNLTLGQAFPEPRIRQILGLKAGDEWDYYRVLRMLANMAGTGEITPEAALRAQKNRAGDVWEKAKDMAAQENGLRALSSYVLGMGGTIYPKGEEIQRGLKMMLDLAREADRKRTDDANVQAFFQAYPEYQPRQVATAYYRGKQAVEEEVDTQLFYIDNAKVHDQYDAQIAYYKRFKDAGFDGFNQELTALYAERSKALDTINQMYGHRAKDPSIYMPVFDRAMFRLREQYYAIDSGDYASTKAMRQAFIKKLSGPGKGRNYYAYQQEADLILREYDQKIQAEPPGKARDALYTARKRKIEELTQTATTEISAQDFSYYLAQGAKEPGDREAEAQKQQDALRTLLSSTREQWPQVFKDNPGLLEKYGSNPDPATAGSLDSIWAGYYALTPKSQAREDYLYANQQAINALRISLGLNPITVNVTPKTGDMPQQQMYDPVTEAIAAAQRAAAAP